VLLDTIYYQRNYCFKETPQMAKNKKPQKSLLSEGAIRRMMKLAEIPHLSNTFLGEDFGKGGDTKEGEEDEPDESGTKKKAYGAPGKGEEKEGGGKAYKNESLFGEQDEEEEALEGELGAEDTVADEEGAELDAEAGGEGEAEITPEAAQAIIDLGAQLEAAGAAEGGEEVEAEEEVIDDVGGEEVEVEDIEEDIFEAALRGLGVEVVDDSATRLNEVKRKIYKRVISRLLKEGKAEKTPTPTKRKIRRRKK